MTRLLRLLPLPAALLLGATACDSRDVLARTASPDGRVYAVLVATGGGTPGAFGFEVHVLPTSRDPVGPETRVARLVDAGRAGGNSGPLLRWASPSELRVEYLRATEAELGQPTVAVAGRVVRVTIDSGVAHPYTAGLPQSNDPRELTLWKRPATP